MPGTGDSLVANERRGHGIPRALEVAIAAAAILVFLPLFVIAAVAIRGTSSGPALFRQRRVGRRGRGFVLLKFRSMKVGSSGAHVTASGDARITPVGRVLRYLKIDELPALWNVLRGDLSLVGPRPEVSTYVDLADPRWQHVLEARPGITDPVAVRLRREEALIGSQSEDPDRFYREILLPFKLAGYLDYLSTRTPWSDCRVLGWTLLAVVWPRAARPPSIDEIRSASGG